MKSNLFLLTSTYNPKKKLKKIHNSFTHRKTKNKFQAKTLQDMQKDLILNLSKNPDVI